MKTILYEDTTTNELHTSKELQELRESVYSMYITDEEIDNIIFENLVQNGGDIQIIDDSLLDLCNRIAIACESERYFTSWEQDENVKAYYESISCNGDFVEDIVKMLIDYEEIELAKEVENW